MSQKDTEYSINHDELYQGYLEKVYQHTFGYQQYTPKELEAFVLQGVCPTYGELLYPAVKKIMRLLELSQQDVFLDLGSGLGKCALQVFMQADVGKVVGIEASKALTKQALLAKDQLKTDFPCFWENDRDLIFIAENFLQSDWHEANIVYTCSTCFTNELLEQIGNRINTQKQIQKVLSLRPLPTIEMPLQKVFPVECSWDTALCFYYKKS